MNAAETIENLNLSQEVSRLRLLVGSLRQEAFDHLWSGLGMDQAEYDAETDRLIYGGDHE